MEEERKKYYMDLEVEDLVYFHDIQDLIVKRYLFGLIKRSVPSKHLYKVTEIIYVEEPKPCCIYNEIARSGLPVKEMNVSFVGVDNGEEINKNVIGYWKANFA